MKTKEIQKKAELLRNGVSVEISGLSFVAKQIPPDTCYKACDYCALDSICQGDVAEVCEELDSPFYNRWYLKLINE